jgi:hypothetical protein
MFTVYSIKVVWGGDACICACVNKMLLGCQKLEKLFYENQNPKDKIRIA